MASISASIPTSSPFLTLLKKPMISTYRSPVLLRLRSMRKMGKVRCSIGVESGRGGLTNPGKTSWPELVGKNGEVAASIIEKENPLVKAIVVLNGSPVTGDIDYNRVWVFVDSEGVVVVTPTAG